LGTVPGDAIDDLIEKVIVDAAQPHPAGRHRRVARPLETAQDSGRHA
jgi:hypothetical protein